MDPRLPTPASRLLGPLFASLTLWVAATTAHAQVTFTFNVTADTTTIVAGPLATNSTAALGYVNGQTYTFTFVTGTSFASNGSSYFETYKNQWTEELKSENQLFVSVSGSGLAGSYSRPAANEGDPYSYLETHKDYGLGVTNNDAIFIGAKADSTNIGLTTIAGASLVKSISVRLDSTETFFSYPNAYTAPNTFFQAYNGTFTPSTPRGDSWDKALVIETVSGAKAFFHVDTFTIATPIPEPSTYVAVLGAAALGFVCLRRRRV